MLSSLVLCAKPLAVTLPEGELEGAGPRMEAGEPLEGRSVSNDKVSMSMDI